MADLEFISSLALETPSKIIFLIIDGLGGLPRPDDGKTELEAARTPNLDALARRSSCGLSQPTGRGITPGSGAAHMALFGYDPLKYPVGRGVLETLGIGFLLEKGDVAARGNFATINDRGIVVDRRAGRIADEKNAELCARLRSIRLPGVEVFVEPVREHRLALILRGPGLSEEIADTDPGREGLPISPITALSPQAQAMANILRDFVAQAQDILRPEEKANAMLLRGFSQVPSFPSMMEVYKLRSAAIVTYPMYGGLAKLLGLELLATEPTLQGQMTTLRRHYGEHDFFFVHIKRPDTMGEDGNFEGKVQALEDVDAIMPQLTELNPDVLVVTGDHSTPAMLRSHSWHPVPFLLYSPSCRPDGLSEFSERACLQGSLGVFHALDAMPLAMGHALKLARFGA